MATRAAAFHAKIRSLNEFTLRLSSTATSMPSPADIIATLRYFSTTLMSVLKEVPSMSPEMLIRRDLESQRLASLPNMNYNGLFDSLTALLDVVPFVSAHGQPGVGKALMQALAVLSYFLKHDLVESLPLTVATSIITLPETVHQVIIDLLCDQLLPSTLDPVNYNPDSAIYASGPAILELVFQNCTPLAYHTRLVEKFMQLKKNIFDDLLFVAAYGSPRARSSAAHQIFRFWPDLIPPGGERRGVMPEEFNWKGYTCQLQECSENYPEATHVCSDSHICVSLLMPTSPSSGGANASGASTAGGGGTAARGTNAAATSVVPHSMSLHGGMASVISSGSNASGTASGAVAAGAAAVAAAAYAIILDPYGPCAVVSGHESLVVYACDSCAQRLRHNKHFPANVPKEVRDRIIRRLVRPIGNNLMSCCQNALCSSPLSTVGALCFDPECLESNQWKPLAMCKKCGEDHVDAHPEHLVQKLPRISIELGPAALHGLVETIVALLRECEPAPSRLCPQLSDDVASQLIAAAAIAGTSAVSTSSSMHQLAGGPTSTISLAASVSPRAAAEYMLMLQPPRLPAQLVEKNQESESKLEPKTALIEPGKQQIGAAGQTAEDRRRLLSRFGIWLLVGLFPSYAQLKPPVLARLLGILFQWFHFTTYISDSHSGASLEKLKSENLKRWLVQVGERNFEVFTSSLTPHPMPTAKVAGHWDLLCPPVHSIYEGLNRILCLVPYDLISFRVWDAVMPQWMDEINAQLNEPEQLGLKVLFSKIFDTDMNPLGFTVDEIYHFITVRFSGSNGQPAASTGSTAASQYQALRWLQVLARLDVVIPLKLLYTSFHDGLDALLKYERQRSIALTRRRRAQLTRFDGSEQDAELAAILATMASENDGELDDGVEIEEDEDEPERPTATPKAVDALDRQVQTTIGHPMTGEHWLVKDPHPPQQQQHQQPQQKQSTGDDSVKLVDVDGNVEFRLQSYNLTCFILMLDTLLKQIHQQQPQLFSLHQGIDDEDSLQLFSLINKMLTCDWHLAGNIVDGNAPAQLKRSDSFDITKSGPLQSLEPRPLQHPPDIKRIAPTAKTRADAASPPPHRSTAEHQYQDEMRKLLPTWERLQQFPTFGAAAAEASAAINGTSPTHAQANNMVATKATEQELTAIANKRLARMWWTLAYKMLQRLSPESETLLASEEPGGDDDIVGGDSTLSDGRSVDGLNSSPLVTDAARGQAKQTDDDHSISTSDTQSLSARQQQPNTKSQRHQTTTSIESRSGGKTTTVKKSVHATAAATISDNTTTRHKQHIRSKLLTTNVTRSADESASLLGTAADGREDSIENVLVQQQQKRLQQRTNTTDDSISTSGSLASSSTQRTWSDAFGHHHQLRKATIETATIEEAADELQSLPKPGRVATEDDDLDDIEEADEAAAESGGGAAYKSGKFRTKAVAKAVSLDEEETGMAAFLVGETTILDENNQRVVPARVNTIYDEDGRGATRQKPQQHTSRATAATVSRHDYAWGQTRGGSTSSTGKDDDDVNSMLRIKSTGLSRQLFYSLERYWHTSQGKFRFSIARLPVALQLVYKTVRALDDDADGGDDSVTLQYIVGCASLMCMNNEALRRSAREHRGFLIWSQERLTIDTLWRALSRRTTGAMTMISVPLLFHCISLPYGVEVFWNLLDDEFLHDSWQVRFRAIMRCNLMFNFMHYGVVQRNVGLKCVLANAFCHTIASVHDIETAVCQRAIICLETIYRASINVLLQCMEQQFDMMLGDRPTILYRIQQLANVLPHESIYSWEFFMDRFDSLYVEGQIQLEQREEIAFASDLKGSDQMGEHFQRKLKRAREALARAQKMRTLITRGKLTNPFHKAPPGANKLGAASGGLNGIGEQYVQLYGEMEPAPTATSTSMSTQAAQAITSAANMAIVPAALRRSCCGMLPKGAAAYLEQFAALGGGTMLDGRVPSGLPSHADIHATIAAMSWRSGLTGGGGGDPTSGSGGAGGNAIGIFGGGGGVSNMTIQAFRIGNASVGLKQSDRSTVYRLVSTFMKFMAARDQQHQATEDGRPAAKLQSNVVRHLAALLGYNMKERCFALPPDNVRSCAAFHAFLASLPEVLDCNVEIGSTILQLAVTILTYCASPQRYASDYQPPNFTLWALEPLQRRYWLRSLFVILYKYQYDSHGISAQLLYLLRICLNTIVAQQHFCREFNKLDEEPEALMRRPGNVAATAAHHHQTAATQSSGGPPATSGAVAAGAPLITGDNLTHMRKEFARLAASGLLADDDVEVTTDTIGREAKIDEFAEEVTGDAADAAVTAHVRGMASMAVVSTESQENVLPSSTISGLRVSSARHRVVTDATPSVATSSAAATARQQQGIRTTRTESERKQAEASDRAYALAKRVEAGHVRRGLYASIPSGKAPDVEHHTFSTTESRDDHHDDNDDEPEDTVVTHTQEFTTTDGEGGGQNIRVQRTRNEQVTSSSSSTTTSPPHHPEGAVVGSELVEQTRNKTTSFGDVKTQKSEETELSDDKTTVQKKTRVESQQSMFAQVQSRRTWTKKTTASHSETLSAREMIDLMDKNKKGTSKTTPRTSDTEAVYSDSQVAAKMGSKSGGADMAVRRRSSLVTTTTTTAVVPGGRNHKGGTAQQLRGSTFSPTSVQVGISKVVKADSGSEPMSSPEQQQVFCISSVPVVPPRKLTCEPVDKSMAITSAGKGRSQSAGRAAQSEEELREDGEFDSRHLPLQSVDQIAQAEAAHHLATSATAAVTTSTGQHALPSALKSADITVSSGDSLLRPTPPGVPFRKTPSQPKFQLPPEHRGRSADETALTDDDDDGIDEADAYAANLRRLSPDRGAKEQTSTQHHDPAAVSAALEPSAALVYAMNSHTGTLRCADEAVQLECPSCSRPVRPMLEDDLLWCIVCVETFVRREPAVSAPLLLEIFVIMSKVAQRYNYSWHYDSGNVVPPLNCRTAARHFQRIVYHQMASKGLFLLLFQSHIVDADFFLAMFSALFDFGEMNALQPLIMVLERANTKKSQWHLVHMHRLLINISCYIEQLPQDFVLIPQYAHNWMQMCQQLERFLTNFHHYLIQTNDYVESNALFRILITVLKTNTVPKSLLEPASRLVSHLLFTQPVDMTQLFELCTVCNRAFQRERDRLALTREVADCLVEIIRLRRATVDENYLIIISFVLQDAGGSLAPNNIVPNVVITPELHDKTLTNACEVFRPHLQECVDFLADLHTINRLKALQSELVHQAQLAQQQKQQQQQQQSSAASGGGGGAETAASGGADHDGHHHHHTQSQYGDHHHHHSGERQTGGASAIPPTLSGSSLAVNGPDASAEQHHHHSGGDTTGHHHQRHQSQPHHHARITAPITALHEDTIGGSIKAGIGQYVALEISQEVSRDPKALQRMLPWLFHPPQTLHSGPREFLENASHIRFLSWLLHGALTHSAVVGDTSSFVCRPLPIETSPQLAEHILSILAGFAEQSKVSVVHMSSLFHVFVLSQLWVVYCEIQSPPSGESVTAHLPIPHDAVTVESAITDFWAKVTPGLLHLLSHSRVMAETIRLHVLTLLEALQECNSSQLVRFFPMWSALLKGYQQPLPTNLKVRFQALEEETNAAVTAGGNTSGGSGVGGGALKAAGGSPASAVVSARTSPGGAIDSSMHAHSAHQRRLHPYLQPHGTTSALAASQTLRNWLRRLQFKMSQIEVQSSAATQFYSI